MDRSTAPHPNGSARRASRIPPALLVALECARVPAALLLLPLRVPWYALRRRALRAELLDSLRHPAPVAEPPRPAVPARAPVVFVSAAEPSGERHAVRLVRELRRLCAELGAPEPRFLGLGGRALEREGVRCLGDPVARAAMGADVLRSLGFYLRLVRDAARAFHAGQVDLFVPVDSPALHAPLGRIARRYGVPSVHYVTPQLWAWAPWRVAGYRAAVDRALSILPFEPAWFAARGVPCAHVGHPQRDALAELQPPSAAPEPALLVLLPGSRASVVERNLPWMLSAAARARLEAPELEVVIAAATPALRTAIDAVRERSGASSWSTVDDGGLHPLLARARLALSVSGTVLIDLLERRLPAVVVYRLSSALEARLAPHALSVPWFSSVNLLVGREVLPEFCFHGQGPLEQVAGLLLQLLRGGALRERVLEGLEEASAALGPPGAARRAARWALAAAHGGDAP